MHEPYTIYINGKKVKKLFRGQEFSKKIKKEKVRIQAKMNGGYSSPVLKTKLDKDARIQVEISGFRFQEFILPYFGISIPLFFFLRQQELVQTWLAIPLFLPVALYAFYHYFWKTDKYIQLDLKDQKNKRSSEAKTA